MCGYYLCVSMHMSATNVETVISEIICQINTISMSNFLISNLIYPFISRWSNINSSRKTKWRKIYFASLSDSLLDWTFAYSWDLEIYGHSVAYTVKMKAHRKPNGVFFLTICCNNFAHCLTWRAVRSNFIAQQRMQLSGKRRGSLFQFAMTVVLPVSTHNFGCMMEKPKCV